MIPTFKQKINGSLRLNLSFFLQNSILQKFTLAITGLGLGIFVLFHLLGNLTLFSSSDIDFNKYTKFLHDRGWLLIVAEIGLVFFFVIHVLTAISIKYKNHKSRPQKYKIVANAGEPSKKSIASLGMIYSGILIFAFLIWHIVMFKYGPGINEGYVTIINGEKTRDLHRLVVEEFNKTWVVALYSFAMLFLSLHLAHGFWSSVRSIGLLEMRKDYIARSFGYLLALFISIGFFIIPIWIYIKF